MQENKEFYVVIKGEKVVVTEEVYRAYVQPIRKEQRRKSRINIKFFGADFGVKINTKKAFKMKEFFRLKWRRCTC